MLERTLSLAILLAAAPLVAQEPVAAGDDELAFPGEVEQVTVDVVVSDDGVPIEGLGPDDFEVYEDGVRQELVSFEAVVIPEAASGETPPPPRIATNQDASDGERGRTFVLFFDDVHLTATTARFAKAAIAEFLREGVRPGDQVTLVSASGDVWWTSRMLAGRDDLLALLERLDGRYVPDTSRERMTDYEAMRIYLRRDKDLAFRVQRRYEEFGVVMPSQNEPQQARYWATSIDPYLATRAAQTYLQASPRNRVSLMGLARSIEALSGTKGRKSLILISDGFIDDPNLDREYNRVVRAARRANTAVYFVDAEGLEGMPTFMTAQFGPPLPHRDQGFVFSEDFEVSEGAYSLASASGGFSIRNSNDLAGGLKRIADENSSYYLLGYNPTNTERDGAFREIEVKVPGRRELDIRARQGYYAPAADGEVPVYEQGVDRVFQEALDSPAEKDEIPLRMTHVVGDVLTPGHAVVEIVTEVDVGALELVEEEGRWVGGVEFVLVAAERGTAEYSRYDQKAELRLLPETLERLRETGFTIRREFELRPGGHRAKIAVRDVNSPRVGTVIHEFEVPDLESFRVSTPILTDTREEGGETPGAPVPVARRRFEAGRPLFCLVEVFGAQGDDGGQPRVVMGYAVMSESGGAIAFAEPTPIRPTSLGHLSRFVRLRLENAPPGDYELVMAFRDMLAGEFLEVREPFTIEAAGAGDAVAPEAGS